MPKYIDMLRQHQETSAPARGTAPVPAGESEEELLTGPAKRGQDKAPAGAQASAAAEAPAAAVDQSDDLAADAEAWLNQCIRLVLSQLKAAAKPRVMQIKKLIAHLKPQVAAVIRNPRQLSAVELKVSEETQHIRSLSDELGGMLEKSMNMLLLSIKMGMQLKLNEDAILSLVLAGMLHHVGLARVPLAVRQKTSALTREERQSIRNAMREGVAYLRDCGLTDEDTLLAIEQSQERIDGSGPMGLQGLDISYMGRIIGLLSFFEALIHYRPYRQRLLPRDAIRDIILHHKASFDAGLLKALIDAASLYPIGTYVQLNSGDIGRVIHVHPRLPLRPTVMLSMDRKGQPIVQREVDLQVQTTLLVERCMYPEDLDKSL